MNDRHKKILESKRRYREKNKDKIKQYYEEHKDKIKERSRSYRLNNQDKVKDYNDSYRLNNSDKLKALKKEYNDKNREYHKQYCKRRHLLKTYNLTLEEAEEIYSRGCEICGSTEKLCIDHCHETGKVRGCLCILCNTALGNYERLRKLDKLPNLHHYLTTHDI